MRFTIAQPEVSCHPEPLLDGARTVVSAALCYWAPAPEPGPGEGRLPRYTWHDRYAELREKLDALGRRLGGAYRVLVDANQHVDREGAGAAGVGFYGKNTMLITRGHGSWVVLGTLVTDVEIEPTPPLDADCGSCTLCIDACPTDALDEPGVLDATRCLSYWTQAPGPVPSTCGSRSGTASTAATSARTSARGTAAIEKRRAGASPCAASPIVSLVDWLERDGRRAAASLDRLYVPRNDARWLRRNALVALGNAGRRRRARVEPCRGERRYVLARRRAWALARSRSVG